MSQHNEGELFMHSTIRRPAARPRPAAQPRHAVQPRHLSALLAGALLTLAWTACTKDAESRSAPEGMPAAAAKAAADPIAAQPVANLQPGAAAVVADEAEAVPLGKTVGGDDSYALTVDAPDRLASGAEGTVRVSIVPKKGWKMNHEFPTKLEVQAPAGVTVTKAEQRVPDAERFEDSGATWAIKVKASDAGTKSFQAKLKFAVCTDTTCDPKKQDLAWAINVE
jgi:hypothetical protein